jgi:Transcription elongation factor, GreA/GreB, C-term
MGKTEPGQLRSQCEELVLALKAHVEHELAEVRRIARDSAEAATHEENRPENDKDMRSTEASYLARGQAERAKTLETSLRVLSNLSLAQKAGAKTISAPALLRLVETKRGQPPTEHRFLLVPTAGGVTLADAQWGAVKSLATTSPLGAALVGAEVGEELEVETPQGLRTYVVASIGD